MGQLRRWALAAACAGGLTLVGVGTTAAFDGFGETTVDSTYGREIRFEVELEGGAPDELEILLRTPGGIGAFVAPVEPGGDTATYVWDTAADYVAPNTPVTYQFRAREGGEVVLGPEGTHRYEDDRPGLDWRSAALGEATVHWYGNNEGQALRFGDLTAEGVARAEALLGAELAGPVDVFVYTTAEDFFGALGPSTREWTGAAAIPPIRTIFMRIEGNSPEYLEIAMLHEVTHIVFRDATDNPYHDPPSWLNEGIATWSEIGDAGPQRDIVVAEAGEGLFSFEAITERFPIGARAAELSYAQGTTLVDMIVDEHGPEAIARIAAAYRDGASDSEALEAGTGVPAAELYAAFFAEFGLDPPAPVTPDPIAASNVDRPAAGVIDPGGVTDPQQPEEEGAPVDGEERTNGATPLLIGVLAVAGALALGGAAWFARRAGRAT